MSHKDKQKRIAVDLDGTLSNTPNFPNLWELSPNELSALYETITPNNKIIAMTNELYDKGYTVFIFTARSNMYQSVTKKWLKDHNVKHHYLIVDKPYYDLFIDDKCIRPEELEDKMKGL